MILLALLLASGVALPAHPPDRRAEPETRLDLRTLMARAVEHYPEIPIVLAEREGAEAMRSQAFWTRWSPRFRSDTVFGLVPAARGDIFSSPDTNRQIDDLGPFYRIHVEANQPLYAFGRIRDAQKAAKALVGSKDAKLEAKQRVAESLAAQAYYGSLLAEHSLRLLADVRRDLERLLDTLEHPGEDDPEPDPVDVLRARRYRYELDKLEATAGRHRSFADRGLALLAGLEPEARVAIAARELDPLEEPEPDYAAGLKAALERDPGIRELDLAVKAAELWASSTRKAGLPALGIDGRFDIGAASNRDRQDNPFVYDPFNVASLTAAFGMRWDFNWFQKRAEAAKDAAQAAELRAKREALRVKLQSDLADAHGRLVEAHRVHEASRRALSVTANWLRLAEENHDLGVSSVKDLVEAYSAFVEARHGLLEAVHDLNLATIDWRLATGREPLAEGESP